MNIKNLKDIPLISLLLMIVVIGRAQPTAHWDFVVAQNGTADFKTVAEAIAAVPDFRKNITRIKIMNGIYKEKIVLPGSKINVMLVGEDVLKTILTYDDYASKKNRFGEEIGTTGSSSFYAFGDGFQAENITFQNTAGPVGQAVAIRVDGDRIQFRNCRFIGFQDTLYPHEERSHQYYKNCYIEGTVDFIFGKSTALFEDCTIFCKQAGFVTAAATLDTAAYGFVFLRCKITGDAPDGTFYLGRPWRPFAKTVFVNCFLDKVIKPEGWNNWNKPDSEKTSYYGEYKSTGPGANPSLRVVWSHQLSDEEAKRYTKEKMFGDWKIE